MKIPVNSIAPSKKILLTSFATWLPHHTSNSSDDLLGHLQEQEDSRLVFLRQLPVAISPASQLVRQKIEEIQPQAIVCCGMAETRSYLTVESRARGGDLVLHTAVNLTNLINGLTFTQISDDAGQFVCEGLYYEILKYVRAKIWQIPCIFIHVPLLDAVNREAIVSDVTQILSRISH
jgi:pyroglutamyl-peptidase